MGFYDKVEETLDPAQGLVSALLVIVIIICVALLLQPSHALRTAGAVWFLAP